MRFSHAAPIFEPDFGPLIAVVGEEEAKKYTHMAGYELEDGTVVHVYQNSDTREYLNLSKDGRAWRYNGSGYRRADRDACILAAAV